MSKTDDSVALVRFSRWISWVGGVVFLVATAVAGWRGDSLRFWHMAGPFILGVNVTGLLWRRAWENWKGLTEKQKAELEGQHAAGRRIGVKFRIEDSGL